MITTCTSTHLQQHRLAHGSFDRPVRFRCAHGTWPSTCATAAFYDDIWTAFAYLVGDGRRLAASSIVLFGRSIGSGPTVELAAQTPGLAGVLLESGLESICRTQGALLCCCAHTCCCCDNFVNTGKLGRVDAPTLLIHGTADRVIAFSNSRNNYPRLQHPVEPFWAAGAGHNDIEELHGAECAMRTIAAARAAAAAAAATAAAAPLRTHRLAAAAFHGSQRGGHVQRLPGAVPRAPDKDSQRRRWQLQWRLLLGFRTHTHTHSTGLGAGTTGG